MLKKLLIAGVVVVLLFIVAAAGATYYVYRRVAPTIAQFSELAKVSDLERGIRNRVRFDPPASLELTEAQVQKLVQVQGAVRQRLGARVAELETKYKSLLEKADTDLADAPSLLRAYGDLASTWMDAKRAQIDALNDAGLSLEEYKWIRDESYRALGMAFVDLDLARLADAARQATPADVERTLRGALEPDGPLSNRELVAKFKKLLESNIALASFGL